MKKAGKNERDYLAIIMIIIIILILFFFFIYHEIFKVKPMNEQMGDLNNRIEQIEIQMQSSANPKEQTEYLKAIEFLENETEKYRSFIQSQQEYLIWLLGVVGTGFLAMLTFLGFENRKKISEIFEQQYSDLVKKEFLGFIGGQEQEEYLLECIEKERRARTKKILFLRQEAKDNDLEKIYMFLDRQGFNVTRKEIKDSEKTADINKMIKLYDVVIYQVGKTEGEIKDKTNKPDNVYAEEKNYIKISRYCSEQQIYGILYCTKGIWLKLEECGNPFYVSSVNFGSTLLERIHCILYFTQEQTDDTTI